MSQQKKQTATAQPARPRGRPRLYDREAVTQQICAQLRLGRSLESICAEPGMPSTGNVLQWAEDDDPKGFKEEYARARHIGYSLLAEEIIKLSDKTGEWVEVHAVDGDGKPRYDAKGQPIMGRVHVPLSQEIIAHKRLQVDTRKWMLSKMLPKVFGDRVTQEHTGAGGGPIAYSQLDMKSLTDEELSTMNQLVMKAAAQQKTEEP